MALSALWLLLTRYGPVRAGRKAIAAIALGAALAGAVASGSAAEEVVIAALGDSLTQGYGLPADEGFVPQLQAWLDEQGTEVRLINAGVSGDTTAGGLSRVSWTLTDEVDAVIVALGGNDVLRGLDPSTSRANLRGILEVSAEQDVEVLLVGITAPGNYGPDYKQTFEGIYPDLASEFGTLLAPNFLAALAEAAEGGAALQTLMQRDGIHPSAEGVALIVEDLGPKVADLAERAAN